MAAETMNCELRIGTSGWHYKHWLGPFYPVNTRLSRMLHYYVSQFDSVELNNSFYRLPSEKTLQAWRTLVPENFVFAVKASRFLTHRIKLKDPMRAVQNFVPRVEVLGASLGPILFQLPPKWKLNLERLAGLLDILPKDHRYAFEFRDITWHLPAVYNLLEKYNAAFCIYELAGFCSPLTLCADFAYIRLHGPGSKYQGDYTSEQLAMWAGRLRKWSRQLKAIYLYFDNDQAGYAAKNALFIKKLLANEEPDYRHVKLEANLNGSVNDPLLFSFRSFLT